MPLVVMTPVRRSVHRYPADLSSASSSSPSYGASPPAEKQAHAISMALTKSGDNTSKYLGFCLQALKYP